MTIEVVPTKKYDHMECFFRGCDNLIKFENIIKFEWTCKGEPIIDCIIFPNGSHVNGFVYWP
jgi:hypothetical protein